MGYKIVYTKSFNGYLRGLQQAGLKKLVTAIRASIAEAAMNGAISLSRTNHGESRIADVEKYDLGDGYRLVVQLVDGTAKTRAFLFTGSHDDTERWLDAHRNYRWVRSKADGTLEFVQVTDRRDERHVPSDRVDLDTPDELLALPLLRVLGPNDWTKLALPEDAEALARSVSGNDYVRDADGILEALDAAAEWEKASVVFDLLVHAHAMEWDQLRRRIAVMKGTAAVAKPDEVAPAMTAAENSEFFITFDDPEDLDGIFRDKSLADWMLFLHPEQRKVSEREFRGPARLRGVSGSGKTCVLVHRARYLAKRYRQPVLLITLTESMRKLLDQLVDDLCGVERDLIHAMTMSAVAKHTVHARHPQSSAFYTVVKRDRQDSILLNVMEHIRTYPELGKTPFAAMDDTKLTGFLREEIAYVRGRLHPADYDTYLDAQAFRRRGRGLPLMEMARRVALDAIRHYDDLLDAAHVLDHEGIVATALRLLDDHPDSSGEFRCVLCDEVQDLSQLDLALVSRLATPDAGSVGTAENGLFLAGDGAQSIYKRGFSLRSIGIDVSSRSFVLRKNYRNTYEILRAAFGLVGEYEFADVDEDDLARPTAPEFAKRHGPRPTILRCDSPAEEARAVATSVASLLAMGHTPGQICVVAPSSLLRDKVRYALDRTGVPHTELREDVDYESDRVKVTTIESAKGHEFGAVFIMGLVEGVLPNTGIDAEIPREAARLYVAMTRARETLTISYSPWEGYPASRFLLAVQADCDEARFQDGKVSRLRR